MKFTRTLTLTALVLAVAASPAWSAQKKNKAAIKEAAVTPAVAAVQTTATAHALVRYGDANKDPLSLITAARMLKGAGSQPSDAKRLSPISKEEKAQADQFSVDGILARAKTLAAGRSDLIALADDVAKGGERGAVVGSRRWQSVVSSGHTDQYRVTFRGDEPAAVAVSGDGDSDLDLYVYDQNGNLICSDDDNTDDMICRWTPRWTGQFIIRIRNRGVANQYVAVHN